nr:MAG TPA: hypothetical protein [Caudoviricetes sp.]
MSRASRRPAPDHQGTQLSTLTVGCPFPLRGETCGA